MKRNQSGFTLIEIAIVLVIIGLLLGGVLKGQELINSARVKNLATDFRNIPVYIYGYQDKYRAVPGDDAHAKDHVGTTATQAAGATAGNGTIDGTWDSTTAAVETQIFWQHVRLAGLANGPTDPATADFRPTNSVGGAIGIQSNSAAFVSIVQNAAGAASLMSGTYIICSQGVLGKYAAQLDITMDDGESDTGSMRMFDPASVGKSVTTATLNANPGKAYTACMGV